MGKHILNNPKTTISDSLAGLTYLNPHTEVYDTTLIVRKPSTNQVHLVCGGGGGHEPAHAAFVGHGMLSAAVSGQVFASPNARQVEKALDKLKHGKGTLVITKNYTGDVLQFGLAKERWAATHLGEDTVRMVVVGDDVAVPRSQGALTGRRGLAGTVLTYKIAGAFAAQEDTSLDEVEHLAQYVSTNCATMGMGLEHCHVPGTDKAEDYLGENEAEIGMGIHNEPGIRKVSPVPSAEKLVDEFLTTITNTDDKERSFLPFQNDGKDEVVLLVNNLGGLPELELGIVVKEAANWLQQKHITVQRAIAGTFMTSLNLPGFSLTLLLLPREPFNPDSSHFETTTQFTKELVLECLDAETQAPGWKWFHRGKPEMKVVSAEDDQKKALDTVETDVKGPKPTDSKVFIAAIENALKSVIEAEPEITRYDTIAGDGDAGLTLKAGAEAILDKISQNAISDRDVVQAMVECSEVVEQEMGGTSGGLYAILLSGLSKGLIEAAKELQQEEATVEVWARALELALNTLYQYTRARPPSRTLIDPLSSFILTLASDASEPKTLVQAFTAAHEAAEATRDLDAKAGRAAYVDQDKIRDAAVPDAGAWGVWKMLEGVQKALKL
ncbi:uncharacterized protein JCM15063_002590 [Sporobolomyces koalae]|uniref:uncharacterized protein n=1 Tax=Sporobolomyces koalae TaxID=500713 RepID=UPI003177D62D